MLEDIGPKIRDLRAAANLTQGELAERAGLTDGFISQVERGRTSIAIDNLKQILDVLNVSLTEFFRVVERRPIIFREEDAVEIEEGGSAILRLLVPGATNRRMEPALLDIGPGETTSLHQPFQGDCFGYVLRGKVQIALGDEIYCAHAGQSFYFTADREHRLSNPAKAPAQALWLTSPPMF